MTGTGQLVAWTGILLLILLPAAAARVDCSEVNVSPVADFEYSVVPAETAPIMVNFYSTSKGGRVGAGGASDPIKSYLWRFGDGSVSEEANPLYTFASSSAGYQAADKPFAVTLMVKTGCGRLAAATKNVSVYCLNHTAGFTLVLPVGEGPYTAPVALFLKDTSVHVDDSVTAYHYTLWDSGMTRLFMESTEKDPTFIIRNGGRYVIRQEIFKACSYPSSRNTEMTKTIEVTGSASSDLIPMETIPYTTTSTEYPATAAQAATPSSAVSVSRTTTPALLPVESPRGTGSLSVVTSPAGARVFVNDVLLGSSPVTIPGFKAGSYILRLEKDGYRQKTVPFDIGEGKVTEYSTAIELEYSGTGIVPILAAVIIITAGAGAVGWYLRKKKRM
jgi:hypothetical protein